MGAQKGQRVKSKGRRDGKKHNWDSWTWSERSKREPVSDEWGEEWDENWYGEYEKDDGFSRNCWRSRQQYSDDDFRNSERSRQQNGKKYRGPAGARWPWE